MSILLDVDPLTGAIETMDFEEVTGKLTIARSMDLQPILDATEMVRNDASEAWRGANNEMWHVASVPLIVLGDWVKEFNRGKAPADRIHSSLDPRDDWQRFFWGKLSSSDYYKFKLTPKNL